VGNLNNQLSFSPKYIFFYNSIDLIGEEKIKLNSYSIKDYITMNKCENSFINKEQHLKNQNNEIIGKLIILNNGSIQKKVQTIKKGVQRNDINRELYRTIMTTAKNTSKKKIFIKTSHIKEEKPNNKSNMTTKEKEKKSNSIIHKKILENY
jgi:hypothetical protein